MHEEVDRLVITPIRNDNQICSQMSQSKAKSHNKSMQNTKPGLARTMRRIGLFSLVLCAAIPTKAQTTNTPISNLNQSSSGYINVGSGGQGVSFTTGKTPSWLSSVSLSMNASTGTFNPSYFAVRIFSDSGGSPGTTVSYTSGNGDPRSSGIYTYTPLNTLQLQTNTTYWIVANELSPPSYAWNVTTNRSLDSSSVWTLGNATSAPAYPHFSVTVTTAGSPPPLSAFRPVVLTFTNFQNAFIVQESPDLSGTNWAPATDLIQLAPVNDARTVFLVPPSSQQMYFRLVAP